MVSCILGSACEQAINEAVRLFTFSCDNLKKSHFTTLFFHHFQSHIPRRFHVILFAVSDWSARGQPETLHIYCPLLGHPRE